MDKKVALKSGGILATVILGSYIFYRHSTGKLNSALWNNILNAVTPPSTVTAISGVSPADVADAGTTGVNSDGSPQTLADSLVSQTDNLSSTAFDNYINYNVKQVALPGGATTGNGNSLRVGTPSALQVNAQVQAQVAENPLLAPSASAVQLAPSVIDWSAVADPSIPGID